MSIKQRLYAVEKAMPACPTCGGTGVRPGAVSKSDDEAAAWFAQLPEADRREVVGQAYRIALMSEDEIRELVDRLRHRDSAMEDQ
jgi:hypothetical protein